MSRVWLYRFGEYEESALNANISAIMGNILFQPRILTWTRVGVCFFGLVAPTSMLFIVILCKAFAVKSISLENVESYV